MSDETHGATRYARYLTLMVEADATALASVRAEVTGWLRQHRWPERRIAEVVLAVNEVITNSVLHAYRDLGGPVTLDAEAVVPFPGMGVATFTIRDRGTWRTTDADRGGPGYGLVVIRDLMDDVRIDTGSAGTTVVLSTPTVALTGA
jgi:serine/threonine-protein kinase RsbW